MAQLSVNERMSNYLRNTAYAGSAVPDLTTNVTRWQKDSTKWTAGFSATQKLKKLVADAATS